MKMKRAAPKYTVHLVFHFHYDVAYVKTFEGYLSICFDNLIEMLNIAGKNPEYTFLIEQAILLDVFWERFPHHRAELRKLAREGRLEISPGMYCMPDMNMPTGESLIRQAMYGRRSVRKKLGIVPVTAWMADCFGHHAQLPQIMKKCGYRYYAFTRGADKLGRKTEFYWRGIDSTKILAHWMFMAYSSLSLQNEAGVPKSEASILEKVNLEAISDRLEKAKRSATGKHVLVPHGEDFQMPVQNAPRTVKIWNRRNRDAVLRFSTSSKFFESVQRDNEPLETVATEFNPVFQGVTSSRIRLKQWNRALEAKILSAENLSTIAHYCGLPFPAEDLDKCWKRILVNQFHDILPGTLVDEAWQEAAELARRTKEDLDGIIQERLDYISRRLPEQEKHRIRILVYNPLSWARKDIVEVKLSISKSGVKGLRVFDSESKEIPSQLASVEYYLPYQGVKDDIKQADVLFGAELPPLGWCVFEIEMSNGRPPCYPGNMQVTPRRMENRLYKLGLSQNGLIRSLVLKEGRGYEFVDSKRPYFNNLAMTRDRGDPWSYYRQMRSDGLGMFDREFKYDPLYTGSPSREVQSKDSPNKVRVLERGPVRAALEIKGILSKGKSTVEFRQVIYFYQELDRIDFSTEILPHGKHYRLRAAFPTPIAGGQIRHEIPFGSFLRPEGEYPAQNWIDYSDDEKGLCLLNKGLPGNNVTGGVMMLSLFRSMCHPRRPGRFRNATLGAFEEGVPHRFEYSLIPYLKKDTDYRPYLRGWELNSPLLARPMETSPTGRRAPERYSLLTIEPANVILTCLKIDTSGRTVVRVYEAEGRRTRAKIRFNKKRFEVCYETDCVEEKRRTKKNKNRETLEFLIKPYEIKTFMFV